MNKWIYYIAGIFGILLNITGIFGILLISYLYLDLQRPIATVVGGEAINPKVKAGDILQINWAITTFRKCPVEVTRSLWGDCGTYPLIGFRGMFPGKVNLTEIHHINVTLPKTVDKGQCHYHAEATYYCNALSRIFPKTIVFPDIPFEVVPSDGNVP